MEWKGSGRQQLPLCSRRDGAFQEPSHEALLEERKHLLQWLLKAVVTTAGRELADRSPEGTQEPCSRP